MTTGTDTASRSPRRPDDAPAPVVGSTKEKALKIAERDLFLDTLAATCNVVTSAAATGRSRKAFYELRRRDPKFAEQWVAALTIGYESVEARLIDYAMGVGGGTIDPVDGASVDGAIGGADRAVPIPGTGLASGRNPGVTGVPPEIQVGLLLLARHRATLDGGKPLRVGRRVVTAAETDAVLNKRLDQLARSLGQTRP